MWPNEEVDCNLTRQSYYQVPSGKISHLRHTNVKEILVCTKLCKLRVRMRGLQFYKVETEYLEKGSADFPT